MSTPPEVDPAQTLAQSFDILYARAIEAGLNNRSHFRLQTTPTTPDSPPTVSIQLTEPGQSEHSEGGTKYTQWVVSDLRAEQLDIQAVDSDRWQRAGKSSGYIRLGVPAIARSFVKLASTKSEMLHFVSRLVAWSGNAQPEELASYKTSLVGAIANSVFRSFTFYDYQGDEPPLFAEVGETHPTRDLIQDRVQVALGKILVKTVCGDFREAQIKDLDEATVARAVQVYDGRGFIKDNFWIKAGIIGGGAVKNRAFLEVLHAKFTGQNGQRILSNLPRRLPLEKAYMTEVLQAYAADPKRDQQAVASLLQSLLPARRYDNVIDPTAMVEEANKLGRAKRRIEGLGDETPLAPLNAYDPAYHSDAFLRLLLLKSHGANLSSQDLWLQIQQDLRHAEIVALLREGGQASRAKELGTMAASLPPPLTAAQQKALVGHLAAGTSWAEAMGRVLWEKD